MLSIPNERWYKYLAMGGVSLFFASVSFSCTSFVDKEKDEIALRAELRPLRERMNLLEIKGINGSSDERKRCEATAGTDLGEQIDCAIAANEAFGKQLDETGKKLELLGEMLAKAKAIEEEIDARSRFFNIRIWLGIVGAIAGAVLALLGFRIWRRQEPDSPFSTPPSAPK